MPFVLMRGVWKSNFQPCHDTCFPVRSQFKNSNNHQFPVDVYGLEEVLFYLFFYL